MGKTKEEKAKAKKGKDSASRNSSSSRPHLEQTVARADPSSLPLTVMMMTTPQFCLFHHRGVSVYAGTLGSPAVEAHTEHRVLVRRDSGPIVPPPPDPILAIWQVSTGLRLRPWILRLCFLIRPHTSRF